jgi:hypothetical protein
MIDQNMRVHNLMLLILFCPSLFEKLDNFLASLFSGNFQKIMVAGFDFGIRICPILQEKIDGIVLPMKNSLGQSSPPNHIGGFLNIFESM